MAGIAVGVPAARAASCSKACPQVATIKIRNVQSTINRVQPTKFGGWATAARGSLPVRCSSSSSSAATTGASVSSNDFATLSQHKVYSAASGAAVELPSLWRAEPGTRCVVVFLTHFADLSSTELAQKLLAVLPELQAAGVGVLAVGLGEVEKAKRFSELLGFPLDLLYADPTGELYTALGFSPGFAPDVNISAYAKLLPMLAGIGSPGTIQEVLRGYIGDRSAKPVFSSGGSSSSGLQAAGNLFDVLGKGYQRPFELATLRLYNMNLVLSHWAELAPSNERLLTQQGGCIGFDGQQVVFRHADAGILKYADCDQMVAAMLAGAGGSSAATPAIKVPTQVLRSLF